jgi:hypothetical protein
VPVTQREFGYTYWYKQTSEAMKNKFTLLEEMTQQLDALDKQQAILQHQAYLASRYAQLCDAMFAEVGSRRDQLEQIILEWEQIEQLYGRDGGMP